MGGVVGRKARRYIALHKPRGYICSRAAEDDRKRIGDLLPKEWSDLFSVGRLDYQSEGLIFLTNDGDFCLKLTHPRYGIAKTYLATIEGRVKPETLHKFTHGLASGGEELQGGARAAAFGQQHQQRGGTGIGGGQEPRGAAALRGGKSHRAAIAARADRPGQTGRVARRQMADVDRTGD